MRSFGETLSNAATSPFSKYVETDEWFASKKNQLEALEAQLKALLKSVEGVVKQRKGKLPRCIPESIIMFSDGSIITNRSGCCDC